MCTTCIYLFQSKIEAATISPKGLRGRDLFQFHHVPPDHDVAKNIKELWQKKATTMQPQKQRCRFGPESSRQTLDTNFQICRQTLCGGLFPKMYGGQIWDLKKSIKIPKRTPPQGSQTYRRLHISQPPMRAHQLFGTPAPASSFGRSLAAVAKDAEKKTCFETSNNTQHKSSFMGHLSLAAFSLAGHPTASDFSLNFCRKNSRQIRWTLQQHPQQACDPLNWYVFLYCTRLSRVCTMIQYRMILCRDM